MSVPAPCSVFNPTEVSQVNTFNNYTGSSGNTWFSSVNSPDYSYSWPGFHSPWSWSQPPPLMMPPPPFGSPSLSPDHCHRGMGFPPMPIGPPSFPMRLPAMAGPAAIQSPEIFTVCLKKGNISDCNGCRNKFGASDGVVIQHKEFRKLNNPHSGLPMSKLGNVYYHPTKVCLEQKFGVPFVGKVVIPDDVKTKLASEQVETLVQQFMIEF